MSDAREELIERIADALDSSTYRGRLSFTEFMDAAKEAWVNFHEERAREAVRDAR